MAQCVDGTEYIPNNGPRMVYDFIPVDKSTYPEAQIRAKLAKNRNWSVCRSWLDEDNKQFVYVCAANANDTVQRTVSYDEACKDFHWKKLEIVNNHQSVKWHKDTAWDKEAEDICSKAHEAAQKNADMQPAKPEVVWQMRL